MLSSSEKVKTLSVNVATSWSTSIIESLRSEAAVVPVTILLTAAKQPSSSMTCDNTCWIEFGASDTLAWILIRAKPTCPAAESKPTAAAVILNGSILPGSRWVLAQCSGFHDSEPQEANNDGNFSLWLNWQKICVGWKVRLDEQLKNKTAESLGSYVLGILPGSLQKTNKVRQHLEIDMK